MKNDLDLDVTTNDVLIIADVQKDFLPGGALGIQGGDQIIPVFNDYINIFKQANAKIVASRDWHPANHISFKDQGGPWEPHCVQGTEGAEFSSSIKLPEKVIVVSKATDPTKEAYSVFDGTELAGMLKSMEITRIFIGGLATEYCIVNSVVDARNAGFDVVVLTDATCGIDVTPGDIDRAFERMKAVGAIQVTLSDFSLPETFPEDDLQEDAADVPLINSEIKKRARIRSKGTIREPRERG